MGTNDPERPSGVLDVGNFSCEYRVRILTGVGAHYTDNAVVLCFHRHLPNILFYAATVFSADFINKYRARQGDKGFFRSICFEDAQVDIGIAVDIAHSPVQTLRVFPDDDSENLPPFQQSSIPEQRIRGRLRTVILS
jgi:hypothetical protein